MQKILAFTGKKQAGKSSAAKLVVGKIVMNNKMFEGCNSFTQTKEGEILLDIKGQQALLPMNPNKESMDWYHNVFYPKVKIYSFANDLKIAACRIFDIPEEWVFGSEEDKNKLTKIKWNEISLRKKEDRANPVFMTTREFMQEFGNLCRIIKPDCWCQNLINRLDSNFCLIDDLRFDNEAEVLKEKGAIIINLEGGIGGDSDSSEVGIDQKYIDFTVDRDKEGFDYKNKQILDYLSSLNFFKEIV